MNLLIPLIVISFALISQTVLLILMSMRYRRMARNVVEHTRNHAREIIASNDRLMRETIKLLPEHLADDILGNWELGRAAAQINIDKIDSDVHKQSNDLPTDPV